MVGPVAAPTRGIGPAQAVNDDEFLGEVEDEETTTDVGTVAPVQLTSPKQSAEKLLPKSLNARPFTPPEGWVSPFAEAATESTAPKAILGGQASGSAQSPAATPRPMNVPQPMSNNAAPSENSQPRNQVTRKTAGVGVPLPLTARHHLGPSAAARHATHRIYPGEPSPYVQAMTELAQPVPLAAKKAPSHIVAFAFAGGMVLGILACALTLVFTPVGLKVGLVPKETFQKLVENALQEERMQVQTMLDSTRKKVDLTAEMEDFRDSQGRKAPEKMSIEELTDEAPLADQ